MVLSDAYPLGFQIGAVELLNYSESRVIRGDVDQPVTLGHAHAVRDRQDAAADDLWPGGERHAKQFFQDPVYKLLQILPTGRVGHSRDN